MPDSTRIYESTTEGPMGDRSTDRLPCPGYFGRYRVDRFLAEGGMGAAYLAYDPRLDIRITLKVPKPELLAYPEALDLFSREAKVLARLNHPHLCRVFDVNCVDGRHYIAMAYVEGVPLKPGHVASARGAVDLVRTLALALATIHRDGVIHRDLKPANILVNARAEPVIIDFGLALDVSKFHHLQEGDRISGTVVYMSPEQARGENALMGAASDVFSLGVILYELLAGVRPFVADTKTETRIMIGNESIAAKPPSQHRRDLDPRLDALCLKALAKPIKSRYADMMAFADALTMFLSTDASGRRKPSFWDRWLSKKAAETPADEIRKPGSGRVDRDSVRLTFVGHGEVAPPLIEAHDRLYLDVGDGLRSAVIDHHHGGVAFGSAASAVLAHPEFAIHALKPWRADDEPFTIVLHRDPDIDAIASTYLALSILCDGRMPDGAEKLAAYVDAIDRGEPGLSLDKPFSPYSALMHISHRQSLMNWESDHDRWESQVEAGLKILAFTVSKMSKTGCDPGDVDAFDTPGLFRSTDRKEIQTDIDRYLAKLENPEVQARIVTLDLRNRQDFDIRKVDALLVRNVQNDGDPERCLFFKDWARTDTKRSPNGHGFEAISVCGPGKTEGTIRGILSVRPDSQLSLEGLATRLDVAETERRIAKFGHDDRLYDPKTKERLPIRPGYRNPDPWYDGRAHKFTIVDAPRGGSWLTIDEIESIFLEFGNAPEPPR